MSHQDATGPVFTASQLLSAFTGGDILTMLTSAATQAQLLGIEVAQVATAPHPMSVQGFRGTTSTGGGGATVPSVNRDGYPGAKAAVSSVLGPPSAGNSTASAEHLFAGGMDVDSGKFSWKPCLPPSLGINDSFHLRASTSTISTAGVTLAVTMTYRETGKNAL